MWGGIAQAVGGIAGALFGARKARQGQRETNEWNASQAQLNRNFQERMSSSAWQRSVADMKQAGINPMLGIMKGGASSPAGGMATASNPEGAGIDAFNNTMQSSANWRAQRSKQKLEQAQIAQVNSATDLTKAQKDSVVLDQAEKKLKGKLADSLTGQLEARKNSALDILMSPVQKVLDWNVNSANKSQMDRIQIKTNQRNRDKNSKKFYGTPKKGSAKNPVNPFYLHRKQK